MWSLVGYFVVNGVLFAGDPIVVQTGMTEQACSIAIEIVTDNPPESEYPVVFFCERET